MVGFPQDKDSQTEDPAEVARRDHRSMLIFLTGNAVAGMMIGLGIAVALVLIDIGGIGSLISRSDSPWLAFLLIAAPMAATLGGAVCASALMMMPRRTEDDP